MSSSVKVVTLVSISLPRISGGKSYEGTSAIADAELQTIRQEVQLIASQHGEPADRLQYLEDIKSHLTNPKKKVAFRLAIRDANEPHYNTPYATCEMETALEVDGRYFKAEEIKI